MENASRIHACQRYFLRQAWIIYCKKGLDISCMLVFNISSIEYRSNIFDLAVFDRHGGNLYELAREGKNECNIKVAWGGEEYGRGTRMDYVEGDIQGGRG